MSLELGHNYKHHLFRFRYTELNEIYWFMALRSFSLSLVAIFIPIYFYVSGYSASNIFLYYFLLYLFEFLSEYPTAYLIKRFGPKHTMISSLPLMVFHIWQLLTLNTYNWSPWAVALPVALSLSLFWEAYHYDFSRTKHRKKATSEVGRMYIIMALAGAAAPMIGGLVATFLGVQWLFIAVILLLTIGSLVLFKTKDTNFRKGKLNLNKIDLNKIEKHVVSYVGIGWETAAGMQIWPLFVFLIVGTYSGIGIITSLALVFGIVLTFIISKRADKGDRINFIKLGSMTTSIIHILQIFADSFLKVFTLNVGRSLAQAVFKPPFDTEYYLHADEESRSEYIYVMESSVDLSRMTFHLILLVMSLFWPLRVVLISGILLGAVGSALVSLMPPAKCDICGNIENEEIRVSRRVNA